MRHEREDIEALAKLLCKIKHPVLDPEQPAPGTMGDRIWQFYEGDARLLLDLFAKFPRAG